METLIVTTKYFENYAIGPNGLEKTPHWKHKGNVDFLIEVDAEDVFYSEEEHVVQAIKELIKDLDNEYVRHEYVSYKFQIPQFKLDSTKFSNLLSNITCNS